MEMSNNPSFRSWLFSRQEIVEKTVGLVVLIVEVFFLLQEVYSIEKKVVITHIFNFLFLIFIYTYLKNDFAKRFSVNNVPDAAKILRLSPASTRKDQISVLVFQANTFISQLKNINYFILSTAVLYALLLSYLGVAWLVEHHKVYLDAELTKYGFHLLIDAFSYAGAFFLLRCFFVMYLPTIDKNGNDILNKKTSIYILVGVALMFLDICTLHKWYGLFLSEYICGVINSVVFILLIARFENKLLDIPPFILCIMYVYAILQTCLPFVSGVAEETFGNYIIVSPDAKTALDSFGNIVLLICLVGKITLSIVMLYVLNTKRIFYYFMALRRIHDEEEKNWGKFFPLVDDFSVEPEKFNITYDKEADSTYTARIPGLFDGISGKGGTPEEAKEELLMEIQSAENRN
jgi:hypothetical protein